jgi:amino acid permease
MVFINYNNNIKNITLPTTIDDLNSLITKKYDISDFYIIANNKLLTPMNYKNINNNNTIIINSRINGGILDILEPIFSPILNPFKDMILAIVDILALVLELLKIIPKLIELATSIFSPDKLLNDVIYGSITGITSMITAILENLSNLFGDSVPKNDGSDGVFGIEDKKKAVCIKPTIINLIILIVCPPLALYINKGLKSIFMIIVCGLMTYYMYYFPGFLFAALHILC